MYNFEYVPKEEWKPIKDELIEIIHELQDVVRNDFTFQYHFVGSSERKMITRDRNSNTGFDFDVNIEVNDPDENHSAEKIRNILRKIRSIIPILMAIRFWDTIIPKTPLGFLQSK